MTDIKENMKFSEASRSVPEEAQKQFSNGSFSGTDINPMWRIKKLTELFGPCGIGWYYEVISERAEEHHDMTMAVVDLNLYVKVDGEWSKPIYGTGGNTLVKSTSKGQKSSDEGYKMALTDALSVAAKALGVGADIYFSKDRTKYSSEPPASERPVEEKVCWCSDCKKAIADGAKRGGAVWPAPDIAAYTTRKFGRPLCVECAKAAQKLADDYANREAGDE